MTRSKVMKNIRSFYRVVLANILGDMVANILDDLAACDPSSRRRMRGAETLEKRAIKGALILLSTVQMMSGRLAIFTFRFGLFSVGVLEPSAM